MNGEQLVQDLIDGARRANAQVEVGSINPGEFFKTAGAERALADLGLLDLEKTAIWSKVLKPALGTAWKHTSGKLVGATAKPLEWAGHKAVGAIRGTFGDTAASLARRIGRGVGREAAGFGLLSGGLSAATAAPGERLEAFGRGFAGGALGGAAWRMGGTATRMGLRKALGKTPAGVSRMKQLHQAGRPGWFGGFRGPEGGLGRGFKSMGAKMLTSGVPFAGALGASTMMPMFEKEHVPQQPQQFQNRMGPVTHGYYRQPAGYY